MCKHISKSVALILFSLSAFIIKAQNNLDTGMHFVHEKSWKDVIAKAKVENKMIFLDCYTTWCGPCKKMSKTIFPQKQVGAFYNAHFINAKVQLDTTENDNDYVKGWYKDGHDISMKYNVRGYPTYLIFNSNGEIISMFGGSMPADEFLKIGKGLLKPENQLYTQLRAYEKGNKSPETLYNLAQLSIQASDMNSGRKYTYEYISTQKNIYTKKNIELLYNVAFSTNDKGFQIALNEGGKADSIIDMPGRSSLLVKSIIMINEGQSFNNLKGKIDFDSVYTSLKQKYVSYADSVLPNLKYNYYYINKEWKEFAATFNDELRRRNITGAELNQFAWLIFLKADKTDTPLLNQALGWSKTSVEKEPKSAENRDTYANLLYKLGRIPEAIEGEKQAINILKSASKNADKYEATLQKMQKGEEINFNTEE